MERKSNPKPVVKKDRRSNSGVSGSPKKGGAGGKGTWGVGGLDDLKISNSRDKHDPNYNSDEDEEVVLAQTEVISPVEAILKEYFSSGDIDEAAKTLKDLNMPDIHQFVKKSLAKGLEKQAYERELISKLLCSLYNNTIPPQKIEEGFQEALNSLEDMVLDTPDAADVLAKFLARAIVDEIVPPAFVKTAEIKTAIAKECISLTNALITEKHRIDRLAHIWGAGDLHSVKRLKEEVTLLLEEYLETGDLVEADKCVRRLNAPSFHFQLVKLALRLGFPKKPEDRKRVLALLASFAKSGLVSRDHICQGFEVCLEVLDDIKLDVPEAPKLFSEMATEAHNQGWLAKQFSVPLSPQPKHQEPQQNHQQDESQNITPSN